MCVFTALLEEQLKPVASQAGSAGHVDELRMCLPLVPAFEAEAPDTQLSTCWDMFGLSRACIWDVRLISMRVWVTTVDLLLAGADDSYTACRNVHVRAGGMNSTRLMSASIHVRRKQRS